jgi:hypothetical protein
MTILNIQFLWILFPIMTVFGNKIEFKKCHTCKHFIPRSFKSEFMIGYYYSNCNKFLKSNPLTGELEFISIHEARNNEELCGLTGTKYKPYDFNETNQNIISDFYE